MAEDIPIIVHGGPHMINVEIRRPNSAPPDKFMVEPDDPKLPFREIVVTEGKKVLLRWPLKEDWRIEIV